jgi:superfamily II DNA or RNA helicase
VPAVLEIISNTRARLIGEPPERALKALDLALSWISPKAQFANGAMWKKFRASGWDGRTHLLVSPAMTFPLGLLHAATEALEGSGVKVEVVDTRPPPPKRNGLKAIKLLDPRAGHAGKPLVLRNYQSEAVAAAWKAERGVLKVPTGGGKTALIAAQIQAFGTRGHTAKTIILLHKRQLARQTQRELAKMLGEPVGLIAEGNWNEEQVTVAIIDTYASPKHAKRCKKLRKTCELLILDEAHHAASLKWSRSARNIMARYRFGLSGTPLDREDGKNISLIGLTGELLYSIQTSALIDAGHLAKPLIKFREIYEPGGLVGELDFEKAYSRGVVENKAFHRAVRKDVREARARGDKVLVLVQRIAHGEALARWLEAPFVSYRDDNEVIDAALKAFEAGEAPVLIASPIFREGINIPSIDSLVLADGGKSVIGTIQKVGRALRPKKGRPNTCVIYDYAMFCNTYLLEHGLTRLNTYKLEGFVIAR